MTRYTDCKNEWFDMWYSDKKSILNCMYNNREADIAAGYSLYSKSIIDQNEMIDSYSKSIDEALENFKSMSESEVDHWCYYDLKKRGAID